MKTLIRSLMFGFAIASVTACPGAPRENAGVAPVLADVPTSSTKDGRRVGEKLVKLGAPAIREMIAMLGGPDDAKARYGIHWLAYYVSRPKAAAEQRVFTQELMGAIEETTEPTTRIFLIRELEAGGNKTAAKAIVPYVADPEYAHIACRALLKLDPDLARREFKQAAASATSATQRILVQALGKTQDPALVPVVAPYVDSDDEMLRLEALQALAGTGAPVAAKYFESLPASSNLYISSKELASKLLYARRLATRGNTKQAVQICRDMLGSPLQVQADGQTTATGREHVHCAALGCLVDILGARAQPQLLEAMKSPSKEVRAAALKLAVKQQGSAASQAWTRAMKELPVEVRAEVVAMLSQRADEPALSAVAAALNDEETSVRLAAARAFLNVRPERALRHLLPFMEHADANELDAVRETLSFLQDRLVSARLAATSKTMPEEARIELFETLAARGAQDQAPTLLEAAETEDGEVRLAALKALDNLARPQDISRLVALLMGNPGKKEFTFAQKALVSAGHKVEDANQRIAPVMAQWGDADVDHKVRLLDTLAKLGGQGAFEKIRDTVADPDERLRDASIRLLAEWPDAVAIPELIKIAKESKSDTHHALALRGYIRLSGSKDVAAETKLQMYREALASARRAEERKQALEAVSTVETTDALEIVLPLLSDESLRQDAARTIYRITVPQKGDDPALDGSAAAEALGKAIDALGDDAMIRRARTRLVKLNATDAATFETLDNEGFARLFNGKDLAGWTGAVDKHKVENGVILCPEGTHGNLFTENEYADFHFRFDYKLGPGGNNGVGIRSPLEGEPAFVGMEVQILDDSHEKWKDLQPWQRHGGIYGVAAAKPGHQKPAGEWNTQEVIARGRQIEVVLNGEEILDVNLDDVASTGTVDGAPHPGLQRTSGHVGFLGHNDRVEFRNVSICDFK